MKKQALSDNDRIGLFLMELVLIPFILSTDVGKGGHFVTILTRNHVLELCNQSWVLYLLFTKCLR